MKNLLIISYDFCLEAGGIQNTSYLLAEEFTKFMNVYTLCPADGHIPNVEKIKSYRSRYNNTQQERNDYAKDANDIVEKIHLEYHLDYVLVLVWNYSEPAYRLKEKYGVPYGVLTHGNEVMSFSLKNYLQHPRSYVKLWLKRKRLLNKATHIFSNTNYTKELVLNITKETSIYVVHPPINLVPKSKSISQNKNKVILSVGRIVERKGFQNVIKALPYIIKHIPDIQYIIAGTGKYESELHELVKKMHLENYVNIKGRVSEKEKEELLSNCGLFVMPSFVIKGEMEVEGFGVAFLEANINGKFVISSLSGGIPEAIKEGITGFLVPENDIIGLSNAILKFYSDSFHYCPKDCVDWAMEHHISNITKQYYNIICNKINK